MANHAEGEPVRAAMISLEQRAKRVAIPGPCRHDEIAIIDWLSPMRLGGRSLPRLIHLGRLYHPGRSAVRLAPFRLARRRSPASPIAAARGVGPARKRYADRERG